MNKKYLPIGSTFLGIFILLSFHPLPAQAKSHPDRQIRHEFLHYLNHPDTSKEKILKTLGEPDKRIKRLGGWEYWIYDHFSFKGEQIVPEHIHSLAFKNGRYVSPDDHARMQDSLWRFMSSRS